MWQPRITQSPDAEDLWLDDPVGLDESVHVHADRTSYGGLRYVFMLGHFCIFDCKSNDLCSYVYHKMRQTVLNDYEVKTMIEPRPKMCAYCHIRNIQIVEVGYSYSTICAPCFENFEHAVRTRYWKRRGHAYHAHVIYITDRRVVSMKYVRPEYMFNPIKGSIHEKFINSLVKKYWVHVIVLGICFAAVIDHVDLSKHKYVIRPPVKPIIMISLSGSY